jgi:hypothetical protein
MIDLYSDQIEYSQKLPNVLLAVNYCCHCKPLIFKIKYITKLLDIPAILPSQFSGSGQIFLHWSAATLKRHVEFQNIFF